MNKVFFYYFKGLDDCVKFLCMSPLDVSNIQQNIYKVIKNKCSKIKNVCGCLWFTVKESSG